MIIFLKSYIPQIWKQIMLTIVIEMMKLNYLLLCQNTYFNFMFKWKKTSHIKKIHEILIDLQTNASNRKNMILENFGKKNHQIWN